MSPTIPVLVSFESLALVNSNPLLLKAVERAFNMPGGMHRVVNAIRRVVGRAEELDLQTSEKLLGIYTMPENRTRPNIIPAAACEVASYGTDAIREVIREFGIVHRNRIEGMQ